jgi:anthranilate phosphoribosyltransferase
MSESNLDWTRLLAQVSASESLSTEQASAAMRSIMRQEATPVQVAAFLLALRTKGESVDEMEGFAEAALEFSSPVRTPGPVVDTCGTGGDRSDTFNISTVSAIVAAGAGAVVAKHGNRAATSRCGSADLLEAMGVKIDLDGEGVERCLEQAGIGFMFAPVFHPAMAYVAPIRRELGVRTAFNFLGPIINPARPKAQLVGVSDARMLPVIANVFARRGTRAVVFQGLDGLDELSTVMPSVVYDVADHQVHKHTLDPEDLDLTHARIADLRGGEVERNVEIANAVLDGGKGPHRDVVLLNAAAALEVVGRADSKIEGIAMSAESIDSGAASRTLQRWIEASNS